MRVVYCFLLLSLLLSCKKDQVVIPREYPEIMEIPKGFPLLDVPVDNEYSLARWQLGKMLFHDPIMSADESISCSSCHSQELSFSDGQQTAIGIEGRTGVRNTPSLANVAYHPYFTREGGVPTLEMQVMVPIQEHNEFDFNILLIAERMQEDEQYLQMSYEAYDREPDPFVITRAIACFERSLLSGYSKVDQFVSHGVFTALSTSQKRGMQLFYSDKTNCSSCHGNFDFTNYDFENNGLYEQYLDEGRYRLTGEDEDLAMFKIPSLRNVSLTGPFMHDGSLATLLEVVEHYNSGGQAHVNRSELIRPLGLSNVEKMDLVHFLEGLTDDEFVSNPIFNN